MGKTIVTVRVENALGDTARAAVAPALVDPQAHYLQIPAELAAKLGLESQDTRVIEAANGARVQCRYVGPVHLQLGGSIAFAGAVESGDRIVLGHIALSALALELDPSEGTLKPVPLRV